MLRKAFFWIHLTAGVVAGVVILVMSVTGALLAFQPQVLRLVERDVRELVPPVPRPEPLPPQALLAGALAARPDLRPASLTLDADPHVAATVAVGREGVLYVDPYTAAVRGEGSRAWRGFFRSVTDWHRWLAASGDARETGKAVTGACNAAFLFLSMSGVYLWWPKQWTWRHLRPVVAFQGGLAGKARDFNWHNVIGLWCAPVIFFLTLTALMISYPAVGNAVYPQQPPAAPARGEAAPPSRRDAAPARGDAGRPASVARGAQAGGEGRAEAPMTPASFAGFDAAWTATRERMPSWTLAVLRVARPGAPLTVSVTESSWRSPYGRSQLTFDTRKGEVVKWEAFGDHPWRRRARNAARWLHTGEILSWPGQLVAGLASLGGAFLVWTGLALAWRRYRAWRRTPSRLAPAVVDGSRSAEPAA
jgi:uncharacterized iron-regulated membrane protein